MVKFKTLIGFVKMQIVHREKQFYQVYQWWDGCGRYVCFLIRFFDHESNPSLPTKVEIYPTCNWFLMIVSEENGKVSHTVPFVPKALSWESTTWFPLIVPQIILEHQKNSLNGERTFTFQPPRTCSPNCTSKIGVCGKKQIGPSWASHTQLLKLELEIHVHKSVHIVRRRLELKGTKLLKLKLEIQVHKSIHSMMRKNTGQ